MCDCQVCKDIARWKDVIKNGTVYDRLEVFSEMYERIELAETDLSFYKAILDGTWPSAQEHLEQALTKLKEQNA